MVSLFCFFVIVFMKLDIIFGKTPLVSSFIFLHHIRSHIGWSQQHKPLLVRGALLHQRLWFQSLDICKSDSSIRYISTNVHLAINV